MRKFLPYRIVAWLPLLLCSATAQANPSADGASVNLNDAIAWTLELNPALLAFGYQIKAQEGSVVQSTLRPNPELGVSIENAVGSGAFEGIDGAETTLSLAWVIERGKRQRRLVAARAGLSLFEADAEVRRLDAVAETARRFLDSLANQERLAQTDEAVRLAEQTVANVEQRVQAGRTPDADLARAEAELTRVRLDRDELEHRLLASNRRLAAQWGETQPGFSRVNGAVYTLPRPDSFSALLSRLDENPNLARYLSERRLREAELQLAQAEAKPDWRVTAGVRHLEQTNDQAFIAGITIPLATRNRNQGRIAEARAKLAMTNANQAATRLQSETQLFALYQELQHSLHRAATLRDEVLPRVERALADTERAYAAGRYGYFELRVVQTEVLNARIALIEASIDSHRNVIEIERFTGATLSTSAANP